MLQLLRPFAKPPAPHQPQGPQPPTDTPARRAHDGAVAEEELALLDKKIAQMGGLTKQLSQRGAAIRELRKWSPPTVPDRYARA